jgi:hypothetical protein
MVKPDETDKAPDGSAKAAPPADEKTARERAAASSHDDATTQERKGAKKYRVKVGFHDKEAGEFKGPGSLVTADDARAHRLQAARIIGDKPEPDDAKDESPAGFAARAREEAAKAAKGQAAADDASGDPNPPDGPDTPPYGDGPRDAATLPGNGVVSTGDAPSVVTGNRPRARSPSGGAA